MSLIENAIERMKKQHDATAAHTSRAPVTARSGPIVQPATASGATTSAFAGLTPIDISAARRIDLDARVLLENRVLPQTHGKHPAESAYRMLRTRVMQRMRSNNWQTLGISAAGPSEGKTLTAINLAISIAAELGQQALLVDLDFRRPSINRYLGIGPDSFTSLSAYLEGEVAEIGELVICPGMDRLGCLLNARPLDRSSDLLTSPRGRMLVEGLRHRLPARSSSMTCRRFWPRMTLSRLRPRSMHCCSSSPRAEPPGRRSVQRRSCCRSST